MAHEVLLMSNISGLGAEGEVVKVAEGYARNYLLPKKLAAPVNQATRRQIEKNRKDREEKDVLNLEQARFQAKEIGKISVTVPVKTADEGKMYGSVSTTQIAEALSAQSVNIKKDQIGLSQPIRELGVYEVEVHLHPKVSATFKLWVVEE